MRRAEIDRPVLEVDDDPVEPGAGHDLHGLDARNGRDRAECRTLLLPQLAETVQRRVPAQLASTVTFVRRSRYHAAELRRHAAAEERHQRPAQRVRPLRGEDHLSAGLIRPRCREAEQIRNPSGNRRCGIDPVHRPRREPDQTIQQQRIMRAGQHDGVGTGRVACAVADEAGREFGGDIAASLTSLPLNAFRRARRDPPNPPASLRSLVKNPGSAPWYIRASRCPWCPAPRPAWSSNWRMPA